MGEVGEAGAAGAPSGRLGHVQIGAWAPRGGRALPARHGGTARPAVARAGAGVGREKGALGGKAGFGQRARSEAAAYWLPCSLFYFFNSFLNHFPSTF